MINVILCDDNPIILQGYGEMINKLAEKHGQEIRLTTYLSGEELLNEPVKRLNEVQIIYLDIVMDQVSGIEVAQKLRSLKCTAEIIFLTANEEYVFEAFEVLPFHYLVKNSFEREKFEQVWLRVMDKVNQKNHEFYLIENASMSKKISLERLAYFEVKNRMLFAYLEDEIIHYYESLEQVAKDLEPMNFLRTHRGYLVNARFITKIEKDHVILTIGKKIPLSKGHYDQVKQGFADYLTAQLL